VTVKFQQTDKTANDPINILVEGGHGDMAIAAPWLETFRDAIGTDQKLNLYARCPELLNICLPWLTEKVKTLDEFNKDRETFSYYLTVTDMVHWTCNELNLVMPVTMAALFQIWLDRSKPFQHFFPHFPKTAPFFSNAVIDAGMNRNTFIFYQMGFKPRDFEYKCERPKEMPEKCLVINDGFASWHRTNRATKCWDIHHWDSFLRRFKSKHPDITIVQVGSGFNSIPLRSDINLIGKTKLADLIAWVTHADYYVGNDSGPTHIRHWSKKPSVVLFGPSPEKYYGYPENINLTSKVCYPCYWMREDWNEVCKLERPGCLRLKKITPDMVMNAIGDIINGEYQKIYRNEIKQTESKTAPKSVINITAGKEKGK